MPYNCEDCGIQGARMNLFFEIRLCKICSHSFKYKLICKSKALSLYKLSNDDLQNNQANEYYCKNPYYKSGPPMTLYLELDIQRIFFNKYNDIIVNKLQINLSENQEDKDQVVNLVVNYLNQIKLDNKKIKFEKILYKLNIDYELLPEWVKKSLSDSKNGIEYEFIINSYLRFKKLLQILNYHGLKKYIDNKICHDYIYQKIKNSKIENEYINNPEQIPYLILFMLNKKKLLKQAIKINNLPISKYKKLYLNYINSIDNSNDISITNDLDTLINYIKDKESRLNELILKLKSKGLELRSDSVLCSRYLEGCNQYTSDEIVDIMEQMNWFFSYTNYSSYCKAYDENYKKSKYYNYEYHNVPRYFSSRYNPNDLDDLDNSDNDLDDLDDFNNSDDSNDYYNINNKQKEIYNKTKSDFVKIQCIKEWIKNGKNGVKPPESLNWLIDKIDINT